MSYEDIKVSQKIEGVTDIKLTRSSARNALRNNTLAEITAVLDDCRNDDAIKCVVITGSDTFFAAGADIKELQKLTPVESLLNKRAAYWKTIREFPKPLLAAVNGYALGGGCELMMHCDIAIAGDNAQFGQPEINLGVIPGAGGTQLLVKAVGKPLAMKMILSGELISAKQALAAGLVAEICPKEITLKRTLEIAATIASKSPLAVILAKDAIQRSFEVSLEAGLELERRSMAVLAASEDREEGINAFFEKRKPVFKGC